MCFTQAFLADLKGHYITGICWILGQRVLNYGYDIMQQNATANGAERDLLPTFFPFRF